MHVFLSKIAVKKLDISTTTVNILLMFNSELNDQWGISAAQGLEFCGQSVEAGILGSLDTQIFLSISIELSMSQHKFASCFSFVGGLNPSLFPGI